MFTCTDIRSSGNYNQKYARHIVWMDCNGSMLDGSQIWGERRKKLSSTLSHWIDFFLFYIILCSVLYLFVFLPVSITIQLYSFFLRKEWLMIVAPIIIEARSHNHLLDGGGLC